MIRFWLLVAAAALAVTVPALPGRQPSAATGYVAPAPARLGIVREGLRSFLVRIDPRTLRQRGATRLALDDHGWAWSYSADGRRLALAGELDARPVPSVLVADAERLSELGRVRVAPSGWVRATTWLRDGRLAVVVSLFAGARVDTGVVVVDGAGHGVVGREVFPGQIAHVARSRGGLVALSAPVSRLGSARLVIVEPSGETSTLVVPGIPAGSEGRPGDEGFRQRVPALAVDPDGGRAFVVDASGLVAVVDLARRRVSYHRATRPRSLLARLHDWLEPAAEAKLVEGPVRVARWLGAGRLAVTGGGYSLVAGRPRFTPLGLEVIDTRTWTLRRLGAGTDSVRPAGDRLLATADLWSSELKLPTPPGLLVYVRDGRLRHRLYGGKRVWVVHADERRAYVSVSGRVDVVDLTSGRVLERRRSVPWPLERPGEPATD